jgi:hypothetical protein
LPRCRNKNLYPQIFSVGAHLSVRPVLICIPTGLHTHRFANLYKRLRLLGRHIGLPQHIPVHLLLNTPLSYLFLYNPKNPCHSWLDNVNAKNIVMSSPSPRLMDKDQTGKRGDGLHTMSSINQNQTKYYYIIYNNGD